MPKIPLMTPFQAHVAAWKDCLRCELGEGRQKIVLARGSCPADVVFIGEAPGESENVIGKPFAGPAGKVLDVIIARSVGKATWCQECGKQQYLTLSGLTCDNGHGYAREDPGQPATFAITNLVGCIPRDEDGKKTAEPDDDHIKECSPRVVDFIKIMRPRLVVRVGKLAKTWLTPGYKHSIEVPGKIPMVDIIHPAAILRANVAGQGIAVQRCIVTITTALESL